MKFTESEKEILKQCIDTEMGFTCKNILARQNMIAETEEEDFKKDLNNYTKKDKKYLETLKKLQEKIIKGELK